MNRTLRPLPGLLLLAALLLPAGRASAADGCPVAEFGPLLECVTAPQSREVVLSGPIELGPLSAQLPLRRTREQLAERHVTVTVPQGVTSGSGGTALLALTPRDARFVAGDAVLTRLSVEQVQALKQFGGCGRGDALCDALAGQGTVAGQSLLDQGLAADAAGRGPTVIGSSAAAAPLPPEDSGGGLLNRYTLVGLAAALILAGYLGYVYRSRLFAGAPAVSHSPPPAPPPTLPDLPRRAEQPAPRRHQEDRPVVQPKGNRRRATVRTGLHPQGYVELDDDLYRAAWADPDVPPPGEGRPVDVVQDPDADVLLAYPPGH